MLLCAVATALPLISQSTVGWLRYAIPPDPPRYHALPHAVVLLGNGSGQAAPEEVTAADELDRGLGHMVAGTDVVLHRFDPRIDSIVLGTTEALHRARIGRSLPGWTEKPLPEEGFRIVHLRRGIREWYILQGGSPRAELWAAFRFAALVAEDQQLPEDFTDMPHLPMRAVSMGPANDLLPLLEGSAQNTTEGPGGKPWPRFGLPRLLASVGLNGLLLEGTVEQATLAAATLRPFGVRVWVRTPTAEPWAAAEVARLTAIPNLGGTVVRAPLHASLQELQRVLQVANEQARLLRRSGGTVILEDALGPPLREASESDSTNAAEASPGQRAAALHTLLEPNVVSGGAAMSAMVPLTGLASANFGLLPAQPQLAAFSVMPRGWDSLAYPAAAWASAMQTPERGLHGDTTLEGLLREPGDMGRHGGVVGALSAADAEHLLRQPLLQANLYAFGRLAWSADLNVDALTDEWSRQTWGDDARAYGVSTRMLLGSTRASASSSNPLGLPLLTNETGGPDPAKALRLRLAGVAVANGSGIGIDRTAEGTNEIASYPEAFARKLQTVAECREEWLLLLHRLPYSAILPSGKTVAQTLYDTQFAGATQMGNAEDEWESTRGLVDEPRHLAVRVFLARAATQAGIWRDVTTEWLQRTGGVRDALGFVGSHLGRIEAEAMQLSGYARESVSPDTASGGERVVCRAADCTASTAFTATDNVYRIEIGYLDEHSGSTFALMVNDEIRARWQDSAAHTVAQVERFIVNGVRLKTGDRVAVQAVPSSGAGAPLDFIEISRDPRWN